MVPVDPAPASYPEPRESAGTFDILLSLAASDLRARYGQGSSRMLKWLVDAYATLGVYLLLVAVFLDRPGGAVGRRDGSSACRKGPGGPVIWCGACPRPLHPTPPHQEGVPPWKTAPPSP